MIAKVVIKKDNKLELHVLWDPSKGGRRSYVGDPSTTSSPSLRSGSDSARDDGENDKNLENGVYYEGQKKVVTRTTIFAISSISEQNGGRDFCILAD
jgi:hypothetical protein